jgi:hypothetical protein
MHGRSFVGSALLRSSLTATIRPDARPADQANGLHS